MSEEKNMKERQEVHKIPFRCRWGFHVWSAWGKPLAFGYSLYQRRTCLLCGILSERKGGHAIQGEDFTLVEDD